MNVQQFHSHEEMQEYLRKAAEEAHLGLHPAQRAIGPGDTWVRFVDVANRLIEFGRVTRPEEVERMILEGGGTAAEVREEVERVEQSIANHYLIGKAHSRYNTPGEWGTTHKAHVWPVDPSLFVDASEVQWQIELLPPSAKINLEAAFRAMRGHVRGDR
jgi:hypothetical protein